MGIKIRAYPYIASCEAFLKSIKPLLHASNYPGRLRWHILGLELKFLLKLIYSIILRKEQKEESFLDFRVRFPSYLEFFTLFVEIFGIQEYRTRQKKKLRLIIDGGSGWGMSIAYFKYFYPQVKIIAIEADKQTASLLQLNLVTNKIKGVTILNKILASKSDRHLFYVRQADTGWSISNTGIEAMVRNRKDYQETKVDSIQLSKLLIQPVDLLKLDIEGMEGEVLSEAKEQLGHVQELIIEYHGISGYKYLSVITQILTEGGFSYRIYNTKGILPRREEKMLCLIHARKNAGS